MESYLTAGNTYYVAVASYEYEVGTYSLSADYLDPNLVFLIRGTYRKSAGRTG